MGLRASFGHLFMIWMADDALLNYFNYYSRDLRRVWARMPWVWNHDGFDQVMIWVGFTLLYSALKINWGLCHARLPFLRTRDRFCSCQGWNRMIERQETYAAFYICMMPESSILRKQICDFVDREVKATSPALWLTRWLSRVAFLQDLLRCVIHWLSMQCIWRKRFRLPSPSYLFPRSAFRSDVNMCGDRCHLKARISKNFSLPRGVRTSDGFTRGSFGIRRLDQQVCKDWDPEQDK
jgi:hypothetical protein